MQIVYRDPKTLRIKRVDEANKEQIEALSALGWQVWDEAAQKNKAAAVKQAQADATKALAEAQKAMAERYPAPEPPLTTLPAKAQPAEPAQSPTSEGKAEPPPAPAVPKKK